jgi:nitrate reductase NapE component
LLPEDPVTHQAPTQPSVARRAWLRLIAFTVVPALVVFAVGGLIVWMVTDSYATLPPSEVLSLQILWVAGLGLAAEVLSVASGLGVVYMSGRESGLDSWHALVAGTACSCLLTLLAIVVVLLV